MPKKAKKAAKFSLRNAKGNIKQRIPYIKLLYVAVAVNLLTIASGFLFGNRLPPEIPLYYGLPSGTGQLADKTMIVLPSIAALSFILVNFAIVLFLKNDFLKKALIVTGLVLSIFSLTTTLEIMFLVGNF